MAAAPTSRDVLRAGLNLMRRLPPKDVHTNLTGLTVLRPDLTEDFLQRVDQPLQVRVDASRRKYLLCDYNRDGDSYRSPFTNAYDPPVSDEEAFYPSPALRALEVEANEVLDAYRVAYYDASSSISSVYCWELDRGFAACFLIKKEVGAGGRFLKRGTWDAIHVIEATPAPDGTPKAYQYKLTSTVILNLTVDKAGTTGTVDLSGSLTRQASTVQTLSADRSHIVCMGTMIEAMEGDLRGSLDALYIAKTREIVAGLQAPGAAAAIAAGRGAGTGGAGAPTAGGHRIMGGVGMVGMAAGDIGAVRLRHATTAAAGGSAAAGGGGKA